MRVETTIHDLSESQWDYLQQTVQTGYDFAQNMTRVCATFTFGELERHVEMPLAVYTAVLVGFTMTRDEVISAYRRQVAQAALMPDVLPDVRDLVRNNCAFCKRERSYKDDNHAPECPYWTVGPGSL